MTAVALDARPPLLLVRLMNPLLRAILPTALGRLIRPFALVEFAGTRTGRRFRVPAGYHEVDGERFVVSPAPWRGNFRGGIPATVHFRGRRFEVTGTLDDSPESVADTLRALARARHGSLRAIGVAIPNDHDLTTADVLAVDRALIRFTSA